MPRDRFARKRRQAEIRIDGQLNFALDLCRNGAGAMAIGSSHLEVPSCQACSDRDDNVSFLECLVPKHAEIKRCINRDIANVEYRSSRACVAQEERISDGLTDQKW